MRSGDGEGLFGGPRAGGLPGSARLATLPRGGDNVRKVLSLALGLFAATSALAEEPQKLTWDLTVDGRKVGTREVTIRELAGQQGIRMLEGWTEIEASALGLKYSYQQRLSGMAGPEPVAFHSVLSDQGDAREVQASHAPRLDRRDRRPGRAEPIFRGAASTSRRSISLIPSPDTVSTASSRSASCPRRRVTFSRGGSSASGPHRSRWEVRRCRSRGSLSRPPTAPGASSTPRMAGWCASRQSPDARSQARYRPHRHSGATSSRSPSRLTVEEVEL